MFNVTISSIPRTFHVTNDTTGEIETHEIIDVIEAFPISIEELSEMLPGETVWIKGHTIEAV